MSKWIEFVQDTDHVSGKTKVYVVRNKDNGFHLGVIKWYGPFRQYSFFPEENCVFEKTCLKDITDFVVKLEEERKANIKAAKV